MEEEGRAISVEGCLACDLTDGRRLLPGGRVHETNHWLVEHCVGPLGVGTLIVKPRRHVVHVAELDETEAEELGSLLRKVAAVVTELADPKQVYVTLWSHAGAVPVHIHWVVQPITASTMAEHADLYGTRLQVEMFDRCVEPQPSEIEAFCERAREVLARLQQ